LLQSLGNDSQVIQADVESLEKGWKAVQVWYMDQGRFVRRVLTTGDGGRRAETMLIYDFEG